MTGNSQVPISMPATDDQDGSREKKRGGVFFGGPLSAMLLSLCFLEQDGVLQRTIPWFGLLPLFISLDRHRHNLKWRLLHGLFFGFILYCWPLVLSGDWNKTSILATAWASLPMIGSWMLFCAAGGVLLRKPSRLAIVPGLALAWTGIEYLRVECIPLAGPWMQLGQALKPENPEGQLAAAIGLTGLGFALCLVNGTFFLALRERRGRVQFFATLVGTGAAISLLSIGGFIGAMLRYLEHPPREALRIGLVQTDDGGSEDHLKLARQLLSSEPQLIFFPADAFAARPDSQPGIQTELETFAREENVTLVASMILESNSEGDRSRTLLHIAKGGVHGKRGRGGALAIDIKEDQSILAVSDRISHSAYHMRRLVASGTRLFLVAGAGTQKGIDNDPLRNRLLAFRALETGTCICRATSNGSSAIVNNTGARRTLAPRNQAWASVSSVPLRDPRRGITYFVAGGWLLGPGCLVLLGILLFLELYRLRKNSAERGNTRPQDSARPS